MWQRLTIVNFFIPFAAITETTQGLKIPDKASTASVNRLNMIDSELFKREALTAYKTMKVIELAKIEPLSCCIRAARLGFAGTADFLIFSVALFTSIGLQKASFSSFTFIGLMILFLDSFTFVRLLMTFFCLSAFIGLLIYLVTCFALMLVPVLMAFMFIELFN